MTRIVRCLLIIALFLLPAELWAQSVKWNEYKSAHFSVFYKDIPFDFVKTVADSAEDEYRQITVRLGFSRERGWMSENRAKIYIYQDDQDYIRNAKQYQWSHGVASVSEKTIRTFPSAHGFFDSTLPHELGHIIFHEYIGFDVEIPLWFEEGVAMHQEKARRLGVDQDVIVALKNDQFISLTDLSNVRLYSDSPKERVQLFYAESASAVNYMIGELGENRFAKLCRELKAGQNFLGAVKAAYVRFSDLGDLNRAWVDYLKQHQ